MKVIDFEKKGNLFRLTLGKDDLDMWYGDDWNDAPYDCNAGSVYERFAVGTVTFAAPFDAAVLEPCDGFWGQNCYWCKDDMEAREIPCIVVVPEKICEKNSWVCDRFINFMADKNVLRIYFGDDIETVKSKIIDIGGTVTDETLTVPAEGE